MPSLRDAERRHTKRFLTVLGKIQKLYVEGQQQTALTKFDAAWGQIQKAWNWSETNYEDDEVALTCLILFPTSGGHLLSFRQHPKQYIHWLETGISAAQLIHHEEGDQGHEDISEIVSGYFNNLGIAYKNLGDPQKALEYQRLALKAAKKTKLDDAEAYAVMAQGVTHKDLGKLDTAIKLHKKALALFRKSQDRNGEANALMNLGVVYYRQNNTTLAIECYEKAEQIFSELNDQRSMSKIFGNLGNVFADIGDFQKAVDYHQQTLSIARHFNDLQGQALALLNMGTGYFQLKNFNKALDCHEQSLKIFREIGAKDGMARAHWNISICLENLGRTGDAIEAATNALNIFEKIDESRADTVRSYILALQEHLAHSAVANAIYTLQTNNEQTVEGFIKIGDAHKTLEQFETAVRYYDRAIDLAPDHADTYYKRGDAYFFLGRLDEAIDDFTHYLQFAPDSARTYGKRGAIYMQCGYLEKALIDQKRAIKLDPKFIDAYFNAGMILIHQNALADAFPYLKKAAELGDPQSKAMVAKVRERLHSDTEFINLDVLQKIRTYSEMKRWIAENSALLDDKVIYDLNKSIDRISRPGVKSNLRKKIKWLQRAAKNRR